MKIHISDGMIYLDSDNGKISIECTINEAIGAILGLIVFAVITAVILIS